MVLKIAVIGAGVNGLSSAVQISEKFKESAKVVIFSKEFTPFTTGDGSAGLWGPYLCGSTDYTKVLQWSKDTHDFLKDLWISPDAGEAGVCLLPIIRMTTSPDGLDSFWKDVVFGCENLSPQELQLLSKEVGKSYTEGMRFVTFTSEPLKLLPYLTKRALKAGCKLVKKDIKNLYEFTEKSDFDVIVNCSGLGAKYIVPDDQVYPVRGQVNRVKANWMYCAFLDESDDGNYIIPNCESIVLGGTHQVNDFNTNPEDKDREFILSGCRKLVKGLHESPILTDWVGLRPGRTSIRLEKEILPNGKIILHNYGHGGSGVTLAWGCGKNILNLLTSKSKL